MLDINFDDEADMAGESETIASRSLLAASVLRSIFQTKIECINILQGVYNLSNRIYWRLFRASSPRHCENPKVKKN
ncbi:hypothetical protein OUZ56_025156 [Daphnia magna]|uniref:Uncharacterized protein n=1 Tax=Daphnia magna TaxID=35525 RepID=A0ABQ9ZJ08_9CRUS|nr:hypothetical protein OUZ56_025156 [Daphnia magna]